MLRGPLLNSSSPSCSQVDNDIRDDRGSDATKEWIASSVWRFGKRKQRHLKLWGEIKAALLNFILENGRAERVETFCLEVYSVPESPLESARRRSRWEGRGVLSSIVAAWDHIRGKSPCPGTVMRAWLSWVDFPHLFFPPSISLPSFPSIWLFPLLPATAQTWRGAFLEHPFPAAVMVTCSVSRDPVWVCLPHSFALSRSGSSRWRWSDSSYKCLWESRAACVPCLPFRHSSSSVLLWSPRIMLALKTNKTKKLETFPCLSCSRGSGRVRHFPGQGEAQEEVWAWQVLCTHLRSVAWLLLILGSSYDESMPQEPSRTCWCLSVSGSRRILCAPRLTLRRGQGRALGVSGVFLVTL